MARSSKTALRLALLILAGLLCTCPARAQLSSGKPPDKQADFGDITEKFIRNMKLLEQMTPEKEVVEKMGIVLDQAQAILKTYRAGSTSQKREALLREKKDLESSPTSKRITDKIKEIDNELQALDREGYFNQARNQVKIAIANLYTVLDQVYTEDADRKDVMRITREHLQIYQSALDKAVQ
jgi:ArsR family metal-binding transcriptional regulator